MKDNISFERTASDQKKRSQASPFKGIKKENIPYVKPLGLARGTVNC